MTFITVSDVRRASGMPSTLLSNADVQSAINVVEPLVARWLNTQFAPTERIDILDGSVTGVFFTKKNPLLSVRELRVNETDVDIDDIKFYRESGKVVRGTDINQADIPRFPQVGGFFAVSQGIVIKYLFGMVGPSTSVTTTTTAAETAGTAVVVNVTSVSTFAQDDWVEFVGMDGNKEIAQISSVSSGALTITVDELIYDHESGAQVSLLEIPIHIKRYMEVEAAIYVNINAIGATFTFNASYNLGELGVVKGVPHIHWNESVRKLINERTELQKRIKIRPHIVV